MEVIAVGCTSGFISQDFSARWFNSPQALIEAFLLGNLPCKIKNKLTSLYNDYYRTALSVDQLREVFADSLTHVEDRKGILTPIWDALYNPKK